MPRWPWHSDAAAAAVGHMQRIISVLKSVVFLVLSPGTWGGGDLTARCPQKRWRWVALLHFANRLSVLAQQKYYY